jgi:hypothetical protein
MELPKSFIESLVDDNTKDGNVILIYCTDLIGEPKSKFLAIVSKSTCGTKFGYVYINSSNYPDVHGMAYIRSQQLIARQSKYKDFLNYDSYFDCSELKQKSIDEIRNILEKDPKRLIGKIDIEDHNLVCKALRENKTISNKVKRLFNLIP